MNSCLRGLSRVLLVSVVACFFAPVACAASAEAIPDRVARLLDKYGISPDAVSLEVRDAHTGDKILSLNSRQPRNPASVIKILTTLSALEILGPSYQWHTRYLADGAIENGALKGNLVMQGGGDPFLVVERFWHQVQAIRQRGIHTIHGDLIIDNRHFDIAPHDRGAFDDQPERLYNVGPDAALVNFSATRFILSPRGNQVRVIADPPLAGLVIENNLRAKRGSCTHPQSGWRLTEVKGGGVRRGNDRVVVRFSGSYRVGCGEHSISRAILSNHEYAFRLFKYLWTDSSGQILGGYRQAKTPPGATQILDYPSQPLADIITGINKYSNNVMARQLFLSLGAEGPDSPGSLAGARQRLRQWLAANAISMPELFIDNGSGLSRDTRISADSLAQLLQHGWNSNYHAEFLSSFALSSLDGTMRKRSGEPGLQGRFRIKTGWLRGVRSMAGYVNSRHNRPYTVVMLLQSGKVRYGSGARIQDALLKWVYEL